MTCDKVWPACPVWFVWQDLQSRAYLQSSLNSPSQLLINLTMADCSHNPSRLLTRGTSTHVLRPSRVDPDESMLERGVRLMYDRYHATPSTTNGSSYVRLVRRTYRFIDIRVRTAIMIISVKLQSTFRATTIFLGLVSRFADYIPLLNV